MCWYYQGELFDPNDSDISDYVGFVYIITNLENGMKYVGKKLFWRTIKRPPLKGKKRKRKEVVQSDWRDYFGSNEKVKALVEEKGYDNFHREIIHFCKSKGELSYLELKEQMDRGVLFDEMYYNGIINARINATHVKNMNKDKLC